MTTRDQLIEELQKRIYIGDGVYAENDGYQIWLHAGNNNIALEPSVMANLKLYEAEVIKTIEAINKLPV